MSEIYESLIKTYLPMSEPSFLLLSSLIEPLHGYGIMQNVNEQTLGRVSLGAGTVYTVLYKMEQDKLIEVVSEQDRRKIYQITHIGKKVLMAECDRINQIARIAARVESEILDNNGPKLLT